MENLETNIDEKTSSIYKRRKSIMSLLLLGFAIGSALAVNKFLIMPYYGEIKNYIGAPIITGVISFVLISIALYVFIKNITKLKRGEKTKEYGLLSGVTGLLISVLISAILSTGLLNGILDDEVINAFDFAKNGFGEFEKLWNQEDLFGKIILSVVPLLLIAILVISIALIIRCAAKTKEDMGNVYDKPFIDENDPLSFVNSVYERYSSLTVDQGNAIANKSFDIFKDSNDIINLSGYDLSKCDFSGCDPDTLKSLSNANFSNSKFSIKSLISLFPNAFSFIQDNDAMCENESVKKIVSAFIRRFGMVVEGFEQPQPMIDLTAYHEEQEVPQTVETKQNDLSKNAALGAQQIPRNDK
jgi:large-conductance mechanosensitive channel